MKGCGGEGERMGQCRWREPCPVAKSVCALNLVCDDHVAYEYASRTAPSLLLPSITCVRGLIIRWSSHHWVCHTLGQPLPVCTPVGRRAQYLSPLAFAGLSIALWGYLAWVAVTTSQHRGPAAAAA
jgi:hypothetical protein